MGVITASAAAALAVSAAGAISGGRAAAKQASLQAEIQRQQAERERQEAALSEQDFRREQSRLEGKRRAALGAAGVEAGEGSPLAVSEDFAGERELQSLRIRSNGELRATRLEQQASLTAFAGRAKRQASFFRAGSLLLKGASKAFDEPSGGTGDPFGTDVFGFK